jgi:hypothetical protein
LNQHVCYSWFFEISGTDHRQSVHNIALLSNPTLFNTVKNVSL